MGVPLHFIPKIVQGGKLYRMVEMTLLWSLYAFLFIKGWATRWFGWIVLVLAVLSTIAFLFVYTTKRVMNATGVTKGLEMTNPVTFKSEAMKMGVNAAQSYATSPSTANAKPNANQKSGSASTNATKPNSGKPLSNTAKSYVKNVKNKAMKNISNRAIQTVKSRFLEKKP